jgi:hypothetical protein
MYPVELMIGLRRPARSARSLPIAGYALDGSEFEGIYLARRKGNDLVYAGKVDHDFTTHRRTTCKRG